MICCRKSKEISKVLTVDKTVLEVCHEIDNHEDRFGSEVFNKSGNLEPISRSIVGLNQTSEDMVPSTSQMESGSKTNLNTSASTMVDSTISQMFPDMFANLPSSCSVCGNAMSIDKGFDDHIQCLPPFFDEI